MQTSEQIDALSKALCSAQGDMKNAPLNKVNPHFRSKYADMAAVRDAIMPALTKHKLSVTQATDIRDGQLILCTRLMHESGQWIEGIYPLPMALDKPQAMGSALSYARRYSLAAICGITADEDDDANAAQDAGKPPARANGNGKPKPAEPNPFVEPTEAERRSASEIIDRMKACDSIEALDRLKSSDDFIAAFRALPESLKDAVARHGKTARAALEASEQAAA